MKRVLVLTVLLCMLVGGLHVPAVASDDYKDYTTAMDFKDTMMDAMIELYASITEPYCEKLAGDADSNVIAVIFMPFLSMEMAYTSGFEENADAASVTAVLAYLGMPDATYEKKAANDYLLTYQDTEKHTVELRGLYDSATGALQFTKHQDGVLTEYMEFVPLGGDQYALQSGTQRAIVSYEGGKVRAFCFASATTDFMGGGEIIYPYETASIYPAATSANTAWVTEKGETLTQTVVYDGKTLTVKGNDVLGNYKEAVISQ